VGSADNPVTSRVNARTVALAKGMARTFINRHVNVGDRSRCEDDLTSDALLGLVEANKTFEAARGVPFSAYASIIIKYRLYDCLRSLLGRNTRRGHGQLGEVLTSRPSEDDTAGDEWTRIGEDDTYAAEAEDQLARDQFLFTVDQWLLHHCSVQECYVHSQRMHGVGMVAIGRELGVTESRVCQIQKAIWYKLRRAGLEDPR